MVKTFLMICSNPQQTAERSLIEADATTIVRTSLWMMLLCTSAYGIVLGSARNASQALASGVKLPLVWVVTLAVCTPAFYGLTHRIDPRRVCARLIGIVRALAGTLASG
jgi:hypothetical protein